MSPYPSYATSGRIGLVAIGLLIELAAVSWICSLYKIFFQPFPSMFAVALAYVVADRYTAITLSGRGKKVGGINTSRLTWSGATSSNIDVNRDGFVVATVPNSGHYNDSTGTTGQASFVYKVCEAGTQTCSNSVTVRFRP